MLTDKEFYNVNGYKIYKSFITKDKIKEMNEIIDHLSATLPISAMVAGKGIHPFFIN